MASTPLWDRFHSASIRTFARSLSGVGFAAWACFSTGCHVHPHITTSSIAFSDIPQADSEGRGRQERIGGTVRGFRPGQQVVIYSKLARWWLQPSLSQPFTPIQNSTVWSNATHLGTDYAALLVNPGFQPSPVLDHLPAVGGAIAALTSSKGVTTKPAYLTFSGYEWRIRNAASSRGGRNFDDVRNVWTDRNGALHLCIARIHNDWTSAEVSLTQSLGYGTYSFQVRDTSRLEPAAVFSMFTWDFSARGRENFNNEMDIEISKWGDPGSKNAQYVVQPYYAGANVFRFSTPSGILKYSMIWKRDRVVFKTASGNESEPAHLVSERALESQVPVPGMESIRMNFYVFRSAKIPLVRNSEVVVEKFEYLP